MAAEDTTPTSAEATPPPAPVFGLLRSVRGGALAGDHPPKETSLRVLVGPATEAQHNTVRPGLFPIACWRAEDMNFEFGSSFPMPDLAPGMVAFKEIFDAHTLTKEEAPPDSTEFTRTPPVSLFGHADPVGDEEYNKTLSGHRARAIHALLVRDVDAWDTLHTDAEWGDRACQLMLTSLGFNGIRTDGTIDDATKQITKRFQTREGLGTSGAFDAPTRHRMHEMYMDVLCADAAGKPYKLDKAQFLGQDSAGGKASYQGCGEFNPVMIFSAHEKEVYDRPKNRAERNNENAPNRRVVALLFRPGTKIDPAKWPCPKASEKTQGCRKRFWSDSTKRLKNGDERREFMKGDGTFGCRFYDRMSTGSPCERGIDDFTSVIAIRIVSVQEESCLSNEPVRIRGHGLDIQAETDDNGYYFRGPVPSGDYTIEFQDVKCNLPSLPFGSVAHVLHAPHTLLPERWGPGFFQTPTTLSGGDTA